MLYSTIRTTSGTQVHAHILFVHTSISLAEVKSPLEWVREGIIHQVISLRGSICVITCLLLKSRGVI